MSDDAQRWKEKYLQSIEHQEELERCWEARLDLLRRGLVRSTLAAEGSDLAVDQCMKEIREIVRRDDMDAKLEALLPRLEKAVLESEGRRQVRTGQIGGALTTLVTQLQTLPLPREISRPLKKLSKTVGERAGQAREIPLLLGEFSELQGRALALLEATPEEGRRGFFERLFGTREPGREAPAAPGLPEPSESVVDRSTSEAPEQSIKPAPEPLSAGEVLALPASLPPSEPRTQALLATEAATLEAWAPAPETAVLPPPARPMPPLALDSLPLPQAMAEAIASIDPQTPAQDVLFALPDSPEPSYSSVASHIEETLLGLLGELTLQERHQFQAQALRERLEHGLNWYELLPILDDLAVLVLAINDSGRQELQSYLEQLNERLQHFQDHMQTAREGQAQGRSSAQDFDCQLRQQVDGLQASVQEATDVTGLKHILETRLEVLLGTLALHRQQRDQLEQETATRLQGLVERVADMENEAQGYRERLEVQQQKALLDPLTGLPNRAAWCERLEVEQAKWQQTGEALAVAMLDLDHFKLINDSYGHLAGDKVLKIIAAELHKRLRSGDFIARFGGEEFVVLMPTTELQCGVDLMQNLRNAIQACPFHFKGQRVTVTVSCGIAAFRQGERSSAVIKRADQALYRAKEAGRNRIEMG